MGKYLLTEKKCISIGGHCYIQSSIIASTCPETYHRICKHCRHTQYGRRRLSDIEWEDSKEQGEIIELKFVKGGDWRNGKAFKFSYTTTSADTTGLP